MGPTTTLLVRWAGADVHIVTRGKSPLKASDVVLPRVDATRTLLFPDV